MKTVLYGLAILITIGTGSTPCAARLSAAASNRLETLISIEAEWRNLRSLLVDHAASAGEREAARAVFGQVAAMELPGYQEHLRESRLLLEQQSQLATPNWARVDENFRQLTVEWRQLKARMRVRGEQFSIFTMFSDFWNDTIWGIPLHAPENEHAYIRGRDRSHMQLDPEQFLLARAQRDLFDWEVNRTPHLYMPEFLRMHVESERIRNRLRPISAEEAQSLVRALEIRLTYYRHLAQTTTDPMLRIRRVSAAVVQDFLGIYRARNRSTVSTLRGNGTNCEGRARLLYGVLSALNLPIPNGWQLGVRLFKRHIDLVLVRDPTPSRGFPVIDLFGQTYSYISGNIYGTAVLARDLIRVRSPMTSVSSSDSDLLLYQADPRHSLRPDGSSTPPDSPADTEGTSLPIPDDVDFANGPIPETAASTAPNPESPLTFSESHEPEGEPADEPLAVADPRVPNSPSTRHAAPIPITAPIRSQDDVRRRVALFASPSWALDPLPERQALHAEIERQIPWIAEAIQNPMVLLEHRAEIARNWSRYFLIGPDPLGIRMYLVHPAFRQALEVTLEYMLQHHDVTRALQLARMTNSIALLPNLIAQSGGSAYFEVSDRSQDAPFQPGRNHLTTGEGRGHTMIAIQSPDMGQFLSAGNPDLALSQRRIPLSIEDAEAMASETIESLLTYDGSRLDFRPLFPSQARWRREYWNIFFHRSGVRRSRLMMLNQMLVTDVTNLITAAEDIPFRNLLQEVIPDVNRCGGLLSNGSVFAYRANQNPYLTGLIQTGSGPSISNYTTMQQAARGTVQSWIALYHRRFPNAAPLPVSVGPAPTRCTLVQPQVL